MVRNIYDYKPEMALEFPKGVSETVPNEATSLKDLVYRSVLNSRLPELLKNQETGPDEDFEDAFEPGQDLSDYVENRNRVFELSKKVKDLQDEIKASKMADNESKEPEQPSDPLEKESV